ncbi:MAG: excisionase family DNA-binding protein [Crocinitomicaceae bacterium]|nr:excisionase family DNA-binding protein [Crocinitomicaceae bacterium]
MENRTLRTEIDSQRLQMIASKEILSFQEAVVYLNVSKSFLYKMTSTRSIRFTKPNNGKLYFRKADLDKWMLSNEYKSKSAIEQEILVKIKKNGIK